MQTNEYLTGTQHHNKQTGEANDISHYLTPNLPVEDVEPSAEEPLTDSMRGNEELDETVFGNTAAGDFVEQEESISHYFTPVSRIEEDHLLTYGELPDSSIVASTQTETIEHHDIDLPGDHLLQDFHFWLTSMDGGC